jgi:hypothetical protein
MELLDMREIASDGFDVYYPGKEVPHAAAY